MSMFRLGDAAKAVAGGPEAVLLFALLVKMGCRLFGRALPWTNHTTKQDGRRTTAGSKDGN
jgi:hypothetical protein